MVAIVSPNSYYWLMLRNYSALLAARDVLDKSARYGGSPILVVGAGCAARGRHSLHPLRNICELPQAVRSLGANRQDVLDKSALYTHRLARIIKKLRKRRKWHNFPSSHRR